MMEEFQMEETNNYEKWCEQWREKFLQMDQEELKKRLPELKEEGDLNAAKILISSHLRLVVKIAFLYQKYGLPIMDMISEGNIGLMKAVKDFDLSKGCKLSTYAMWWIRASIQDYILKSWSLVKIGTTVNQKKLFFNLSKVKNKILEYNQKSLTNENIKYIANELSVPEDDVVFMEKRMSKKDVSLNKISNNTDDGSRELIEFLPSKYSTPENILISRDKNKKSKNLMKKAMSLLDDREKDIIYNRKLKDSPLTLKELSDKYNISGERIRQIEENALKKMKKYIIDNME